MIEHHTKKSNIF